MTRSAVSASCIFIRAVSARGAVIRKGLFLVNFYQNFFDEGQLVKFLLEKIEVVGRFQKRQRSQAEGGALGEKRITQATSLDYLIRLRFVNTLICDHKPSDL